MENFNPFLENINKSVEITVYFKSDNLLESSHFKIIGISKKTKPTFISLKSLWTYTATDKVLILSTNRGLITDRQGREYSIGGELICTINPLYK